MTKICKIQECSQKETLEYIRDKLDKIDDKLDKKADKQFVYWIVGILFSLFLLFNKII